MLVSDEFCFSSWFNCNTCWCKLNECLEMNRLSHFSQANLRKGWTIYWWIFRSDSLVNFSSQSLQSIVLLSDFACINFICVFNYLMQLNSFEHSTQLTLVRVISCVSINYCLKKMICRIGHIEGLLSFSEHLLFVNSQFTTCWKRLLTLTTYVIFLSVMASEVWSEATRFPFQSIWANFDFSHNLEKFFLIWLSGTPIYTWRPRRPALYGLKAKTSPPGDRLKSNTHILQA